jgi:hypothetical protein
MIIIKLLILLTLLIGLAVLFFFRPRKFQIKKGVNVSLDTIHTTIGWGYIIKINDKVYIQQTFVPVIETHTGFKTRLEAENTGRMVVEKLLNNESQVLSIQDLQKAGVHINYNLTRSNSTTN